MAKNRTRFVNTPEESEDELQRRNRTRYSVEEKRQHKAVFTALAPEIQERFHAFDYQYGHLVYGYYRLDLTLDQIEALWDEDREEEAREIVGDDEFGLVVKRYADDHSLVYNEDGTLNARACPVCGRTPEQGGPDPCLGYLPGVRYACCGHGRPQDAYIMFENKIVIRQFETIETPRARGE